MEFNGGLAELGCMAYLAGAVRRAVHRVQLVIVGSVLHRIF